MINDIFITRIQINKVRHLENLVIKLSEDARKHLILTGKNGSGKTSLLLAIYDNFSRDRKNNSVIIKFNNSLPSRFLRPYFPAKRSIQIKPSEGAKKFSRGDSFLQYLVNLKVTKSFARDDNDMDTVGEIDLWFTTFENALRELFEDHTLTLQFDRKNYNFQIFSKNREPFDFKTLADGHSAALNILTDLIILIELDGTAGYSTPGIVLIDEIETHLHVSLQKKILPFLIDFFPKIQFIVSTHSPFVLNSLEDAVIYDLENRIRDEVPNTYSGLSKYRESIERKDIHI